MYLSYSTMCNVQVHTILREKTSRSLQFTVAWIPEREEGGSFLYSSDIDYFILENVWFIGESGSHVASSAVVKRLTDG